MARTTRVCGGAGYVRAQTVGLLRGSGHGLRQPVAGEGHRLALPDDLAVMLRTCVMLSVAAKALQRAANLCKQSREASSMPGFSALISTPDCPPWGDRSAGRRLQHRTIPTQGGLRLPNWQELCRQLFR